MKRPEATVSIERLEQDLREIAEIGKAGGGGVFRMAFTAADMRGRDWLEEKMREAGLSPRRDGACNVIGRLAGRDPEKPALMIGSHIDTVPCAGMLDGALGVLTGLECLRVLNQQGATPERDIELIAFSDEEGRFGGMFGSQAFTGQITPDTIHRAADPAGERLEDAMRAAGLDPWEALKARRDPRTAAGYIELHIEQGPVLAAAAEQVGVVEAITGLFKWSVGFTGEPNHAGTTPMPMRRDAFMGVADFAHEIPRIIEENGSEVSRATIGRVELTPGSPNTVPGEAVFTIDVRDTDEAVMTELAAAIRKALTAIARRRGLHFHYTEESWIKPVDCDPQLVDTIDAAKGWGIFADPENSGVPEEGRNYYFDRLEKTVIPGMRRLQDAFRQAGLEVIHCRICALTRNGRDRSAGHRRLHLLAAKGSKEAEFLEEVAPVGDEIIIDKTASGVFSSTNLHYVLGNLGIQSLYICGVYTNECVETTARDACDLGYFVTVVDDACATVTPALHTASLACLRDRYARICPVDEAMHDLDNLRAARTGGTTIVPA